MTKNLLQALIAQHPQNYIKPNGFFIAWNGVPMLTYEGFSPALLSVKEQLNLQLSKLRTENPGSKWAGTTLGALLDNRTLSFAELEEIKAICLAFEPLFQQVSPILISELSYVLFEQRSLEKTLLDIPLPFNATIDQTAPSTTHLSETRLIHEQFSVANLEAYLPKVQQIGNRESHYRLPHVESTLVAWIPEPPIVQQFIQVLNHALPDTFAWFSPESRHVTIRALVFD